MDTLKKIWPRAFKKYDSVADLIVGILVYILLVFVAGIAIGLCATIVGWIPLVGDLLAWVLGVISSLLGLYLLVGIILAILNYCNVLK